MWSDWVLRSPQGATGCQHEYGHEVSEANISVYLNTWPSKMKITGNKNFTASLTAKPGHVIKFWPRACEQVRLAGSILRGRVMPFLVHSSFLLAESGCDGWSWSSHLGP